MRSCTASISSASRDDALAMLPPRTRRRAAQALGALAGRGPAYLENGEGLAP